MRYLLIGAGICMMAAGVMTAPASAAEAPLGLGLYQASSWSPALAYASFSAWIAPKAVLSFGMTFSTEDDSNFGFYTRFGYKMRERERVGLLLGATLEVAEAAEDAILGFGPFVGLDARLADNFSVIADGYPFQIVHEDDDFPGDDDTEVIFFDGRLGAAWWF